MINEAALAQFGYNRGELSGRSIECLLPARHREQFLLHGNIADMETAGMSGTGQPFCGLRKNGSEFPMEASVSTFSTEDGPAFVAFTSDITVRAAAANALVRLKDELAKKVEARTQALRVALEHEAGLSELKSRFVSTASHEFRTPLSAILSSANLVSSYSSPDNVLLREKHIARIVSSVTTLTGILEDFLSVGRIEEGAVRLQSETISIRSWMNEVLEELEPALKSGQHLSYAHTGCDTAVLDPSALKHIVQNLVSNAVKFSTEGSPIVLETNCDAACFTLTVVDVGIGIPVEDQQHLSRRFFRAANAANIQGTGLGLHIVYKYAELMNGTVSFTSNVDEGTTFAVSLSLQKPGS